MSYKTHIYPSYQLANLEKWYEETKYTHHIVNHCDVDIDNDFMHAKFAFYKFIVLHTKVNVNVALDINYVVYYILINFDMQLIAMHYIWNKLILSLFCEKRNL